MKAVIFVSLILIVFELFLLLLNVNCNNNLAFSKRKNFLTSLQQKIFFLFPFSFNIQSKPIGKYSFNFFGITEQRSLLLCSFDLHFVHVLTSLCGTCIFEFFNKHNVFLCEIEMYLICCLF